MKFARRGMSFTTSWPASDLEMMEQSVDDYIGMEQFHAYYMTFSGHYKYDTSLNPMAKRNWDAVKDLEGYSNPVKAYLACNIELEKAMAYLMQRLEEQGIACQIHYPVATHLHKAYRDLGCKEGDFPVAEYNAAHELSLPMYYGMTDEQISYVIDVLNRF